MSINEGIRKTIKHYSRYNRTYLRNKLYDFSLRKYIESRYDLYQLWKDYPELEELYKKKINPYLDEITPFHKEYTTGVSNPVMAASLELSIFLLILCDLNKPKRIIDFGSGFTSFIFRYYARHDPDIEVWSVDDSSEWLKKTEAFLKSKNVSLKNLFSLESVKQKLTAPFDLILYDMGTFETRMANLKYVLGMLAKDGIIVLDDMHGADYGCFVMDSLKKNRFKKYSISHYTKDCYDRYSFIGKKI